MLLTMNYSMGQVYAREDTTLNIFNINDSLKYFEFYTPEFTPTNAGCGILSKLDKNVYILKYADEPNYDTFKIIFRPKGIEIIRTSNIGFIPYSLERNKEDLTLTRIIPKQKVSQFYENYRILYRAKKMSKIKVYEYPCDESESKLTPIKKGTILQRKWSVGTYNKFTPIKNKTWIAVVCKDKYIGWLLLSDADAAFERIEP